MSFCPATKRDLVFLKTLVTRGHLWEQIAYMTNWSDAQIRENFFQLAEYRRNGWLT